MFGSGVKRPGWGVNLGGFRILVPSANRPLENEPRAQRLVQQVIAARLASRLRIGERR